ncbi:hypothetical protein HJB86_27645 [Rhizobium sp. NZLR3b]|nr:hypothetical protein [Rhizobium sp. NZLR3b]
MSLKLFCASQLVLALSLFACDPAEAYIDPCEPFAFPVTRQWKDVFKLGALDVKYVGTVTHFVNETKRDQAAEIVQEVMIYFDDLEHVHFNRGHIRLLRSSLHIPAV